jgi:hypothetical protein
LDGICLWPQLLTNDAIVATVGFMLFESRNTSLEMAHIMRWSSRSQEKYKNSMPPNICTRHDLQNKTGEEIPFLRSIEIKNLHQPDILASNHVQQTLVLIRCPLETQARRVLRNENFSDSHSSWSGHCTSSISRWHCPVLVGPSISLLATIVFRIKGANLKHDRVDQSAILVNGSIIGGLQSPPSGWFQAIVQGAVYIAALESRNEALAFQQLAVSHAAHDSLVWIFHGTRLYATVDSKLKAVLAPIGISQSSVDYQRATNIGRNAAVNITRARSDDGINNFVDYVQQPAVPGVYQQTPDGSPIPDTPQARYIRLFGGLGDVTRFRAPPPPSINSSGYEDFLLYVKQQGARNSTVRRSYDTETAYFWRESSPM